MKKQKILLVDNSVIVAKGVSAILEGSSDYQIVGFEDELNRLEERILVLKPDIVIINPALIDLDIKTNLQSYFNDFQGLIIIALIRSYIPSHILKQFDTVIEIEDDRKKIENKLKDILRDKNNGDSFNRENYELTDRETDVLIAIAKGMMNKEIADKLNISIHTVISHRKNIIRKTGIKSVAGLTVYSLLNNLIEESDVE